MCWGPPFFCTCPLNITTADASVGDRYTLVQNSESRNDWVTDAACCCWSFYSKCGTNLNSIGLQEQVCTLSRKWSTCGYNSDDVLNHQRWREKRFFRFYKLSQTVLWFVFKGPVWRIWWQLLARLKISTIVIAFISTSPAAAVKNLRNVKVPL